MGELIDPEHMPAMRASIERLDTEAQQLVDTFGVAVPQIDPTQDNPNVREILFTPEAIIAAGFEPDTVITLSDEPPYLLEGEMTRHKEVFVVHRGDRLIVHERTVYLDHQPDGTITVVLDNDVMPQEVGEVELPETFDEAALKKVAKFLLNKLIERAHDIFSLAECDQLLLLIAKEKELRG